MGTDCSFHGRLATELPDVGSVVNHLDEEVEAISRHDGVAEFRFVDAQEVHQTIRRVEGIGSICEYAADLGQGFDDEYARHDRSIGEMTLKPRLVVRHHFVPVDADSRHDIGNPVDQHEREPVREDLQDSSDVEREGSA